MIGISGIVSLEGAARLGFGPGGASPRLAIDEKAGLEVLADARLDNRPELCRSLGLGAGAAGELSDAGVILAAWREWGPACLDRLLGDFAFAVWDARHRRCFLARDPMGIRPLAYLLDGERLVFGTTARAVAQASENKPGLNRARIGDFLLGLEGIDHECTFYEGVRRLPPGHWAIFERSRMNLRRYWRPQAGEEPGFGSDEEYLARFEQLFSRAVSDRLAASAPVASMLSGGLDSGTIVGMARSVATGPLATFSGVADDERHCPESGAIRAVLGQGGLDAFTLRPGDLQALQPGLNEVLGQMEEPWDALMTLPAALYLAAAQRGHAAVLDGVDGDLLLALPESYPLYLFRQGHWRQAWHEHRAQARNYYRTRPRAWPFLRMVAGSHAPGPWRLWRRGNRRVQTLEALLQQSPVSRQLAVEVGLVERDARERKASSAPSGRGLSEAAAWRMGVPYLAAGVERYQRTAALCGIEHRKPLLDRRLVEFCCRLPWNQRNRDGWSKYLLRRLAEKYLPKEVAWRRGTEHLGWDFNVARLRAGSEEHLERLSAHRQAMTEWVAEAAIGRVLGKLRAETPEIDEEVRMVTDLAAWLDHQGFL